MNLPTIGKNKIISEIPNCRTMKYYERQVMDNFADAKRQGEKSAI